jgi:hypothetical protein
VAYGVDAMVEPMKASALDRPADGRMGVTKPSQLPNRDDAMLPVRQLGQSPSPW